MSKRLGWAEVLVLFAIPAMLISESCIPQDIEVIEETGLSANAGDGRPFNYEIPAGATNLSFVLLLPEGNADLYVAFDRQPTTSDYDCGSTNPNNTAEACFFANPAGGTYFVNVHAVTDFSNAVLRISYVRPPAPVCGNGVIEQGEACDDGNTEDDDGCNAMCQAEWVGSEQIEQSVGDAGQPQVALDANGNAIAVWQQTDGTRMNIWAGRFTSQDGWSTPELLEHDTSDAQGPQVVVAPDGGAVAIWQQSKSIVAARYAPTTGWGSPEPVEDDWGEAFEPQISMDPAGNAIAVWRQRYRIDGYWNHHVWANRFTPETGWDVPELVERNRSDAFKPQIAVGDNGDAMAVWEQVDGNMSSVWACRLASGGSWEEPILLENDDSVGAYEPQAALDAAGNAVSVWTQDNDIWSKRFTPSGGWGSAERLNVLLDASRPQIAVDAVGNAIAVWQEFRYVGSYYRRRVYARRYTSVDGWGEAWGLEALRGCFPQCDADERDPQIEIDSEGNAVAVWTEGFVGGYQEIAFNRFTPSAGWGSAEIISIRYLVWSYEPQVATNQTGAVVAVWRQGSYAQHIWSNRLQ